MCDCLEDLLCFFYFLLLVRPILKYLLFHLGGFITKEAGWHMLLKTTCSLQLVRKVVRHVHFLTSDEGKLTKPADT